MGGHGEEAGFGAARGIGEVAGLGQRALGFSAVGYVAADALHFRRPARVRSNQALAPGDPARPERRCDLLVVNPGAVGFDCRVALLEDGRCETAAEQRGARPRDQFAIGIVDKGNAALGVTQDDQIALGFEQAAGALLGLLQFPVAVGQRFIVQSDLAQPSAHPAQPDAQRGERDAGDREQETRTDGKSVRVVAGILRSASDDETIGAAERGGEDRERSDREGQHGMPPPEAAEPQLDPENHPHDRRPRKLRSPPRSFRAIPRERALARAACWRRRCGDDLAKCLR